MFAASATLTTLAPRGMSSFSRISSTSSSTRDTRGKAKCVMKTHRATPRGGIQVRDGFATRTHVVRRWVATRAAGSGHTAPQHDPRDPRLAQSAQPRYAPGHNVFHEPPPVPTTQNHLDVMYPNGEHQVTHLQGEEGHAVMANNVASAPQHGQYPSVNPDTPSYLYELESTRAMLIDLEAHAVQGRDYATASASAQYIERLIQIESELLMHDTSEMEASLAQEYAAALSHKQKKDALLTELSNIQHDLYSGNGSLTGAAQGGETETGGQAAAGSKKAKSGAAGLLVPVRFSVNAETNFGETVVVCGSIPELGNWDTAQAPEMSYVEGKKAWGITVQLPKGSNFRFKFVIGVQKDGQEEVGEGGEGEISGATARKVERNWYWQEGADRAIQMPLNEVISMDVVVDWGGDSDKEKMWLCMPVPHAPAPSPDGQTR